MARRLLTLWLLAIATSVLATLPAAADDKVGPDNPATDPCNSRLAVQVGSDGRFNIGAFPDAATCAATGDSWDIMYRWPSSPWSSFSTVRIDGSDNVYGSVGSQIEAPTDVNATTSRSKWQIGDVETTQTLEIVFNNQTGQTDVAKISYTLQNTGSVAHDAGLRIMIDTELNYNDGAPFRIPGVGAITSEMEFVGAAVPDTFQAFFDLTDAAHVSAGTLKSGGATPPDRFVIARWPGINGTTWDYTTTPGSGITGDSAYAAYWNPAVLNPGESRSYVTYYGLAEVNIDLQPPLALGVTGPAALSVVGAGYSPNPFDVVATVFNNGTGAATDVQLTLNLPAGLSLASGSGTQSIGDLAVGQERQVSWSVLASAQSSSTTLTYSVTADGSNTEPKTVERQITLPAVAGQLKILFIQGIGSSTCPDDREFERQVSWMRSALTERVAGLSDSDFLYYEYTSAYSGGTECSGSGGYTNLDACWSLDDSYTQSFIGRTVPGGGQAARLASYLRSHLDSHPGSKVSVVAHSQGGVLAAYAVKEKLSESYQARIKGIVTLDSPLRGINSLGPGVLRSAAGCANNDLRLDSSFDMKPRSAVINRIDDAQRPSTKLYTVDADPGCQPLPANRCTRFALIDDFHSDASWSTDHLSVDAETHSDIWDGCFVQGEFRYCATSSGDGLVQEGIRLVRFTACGTAALADDCSAFADQPE